MSYEFSYTELESDILALPSTASEVITTLAG
jgi:hypothetical protein